MIRKLTPEVAKQLAQLAIQGKLETVRVNKNNGNKNSRKNKSKFKVSYTEREPVFVRENFHYRQNGFTIFNTIAELLEKDELIGIKVSKVQDSERYFYKIKAKPKEEHHALEANS